VIIFLSPCHCYDDNDDDKCHIHVLCVQFRAESFLKSSATDGIKPTSLTLTTSSSSSARRHRPTTTPTTTTGGTGRRRSSVSLPSARQSVVPRSLSSSLPLPPPSSSRGPHDTSTGVKQDDLTTSAAVQAIFDVSRCRFCLKWAHKPPQRTATAPDSVADCFFREGGLGKSLMALRG